MFKKMIFLASFLLLSLAGSISTSDFRLNTDQNKIDLSNNDDLVSPECWELVKVSCASAVTTVLYLADMPLLGSLGAATTCMYVWQAEQKIAKELEKQEQLQDALARSKKLD